MKDEAAVFERDRYLVIPKLLEKPSLTRFYRYVCKAVEAPHGGLVDCLVPEAPFAYGDFITDGLMVSLQRRIEEASGLTLFPTYSYCRVYKHGDQLPRHRDRPACELSISLCLRCDPKKPWPLWIEGPQGASSIILQPGDAVLYRGIECFHWREVFDGEHQAHLFFHYVDQYGPNAQWKFDKRAALGDPLVITQQ
jgi:hypothetical protein